MYKTSRHGFCWAITYAVDIRISLQVHVGMKDSVALGEQGGKAFPNPQWDESNTSSRHPQNNYITRSQVERTRTSKALTYVTDTQFKSWIYAPFRSEIAIPTHVAGILYLVMTERNSRGSGWWRPLTFLGKPFRSPFVELPIVPYPPRG